MPLTWRQSKLPSVGAVEADFEVAGGRLDEIAESFRAMPVPPRAKRAPVFHHHIEMAVLAGASRRPGRLISLPAPPKVAPVWMVVVGLSRRSLPVRVATLVVLKVKPPVVAPSRCEFRLQP